MLWITVLDTELPFEHSLVSLSTWEAKHEKPFFPKTEDDRLTPDEMISYFESMYVGPRKHFDLVQLLSEEDQIRLVEYVNSSRTATIVKTVQAKPGPKEHVTSELIYYWLVAFKIPFEPSDGWHLNRLLKLVEVCAAKQDTTKKDPKAVVKDMRAENARRRALYGTRG